MELEFSTNYLQMPLLRRSPLITLKISLKVLKLALGNYLS